MTNVVKVKLELADDGREYNSGSVISRKSQFVEIIDEASAKALLLAGKDVYFVYSPNEDIKETWIKLCKDIDYLADHYSYGETCGILLNKHMLSDCEYELVNKIAGLSGMACWFQLSPTGHEYEVHDVEDNRDMSLVNGLKMLFEGVLSLDAYSCTEYEKTVCRNLCERLNINFTV